MKLFIAGFIFLFICFPAGVAMIGYSIYEACSKEEE